MVAQMLGLVVGKVGVSVKVRVGLGDKVAQGSADGRDKAGVSDAPSWYLDRWRDRVAR